jgi:hypothetical protein
VLGSGLLPSAIGTDSFQVSADDDDGGVAVTTVTYTVTASQGLEPFTSGITLSPPAPPAPGSEVFASTQSISALRQFSSRWHGGNTLPATRTGAAPPPPRSGTYFSFSSSTAGELQIVFRRQQPGRKHGPLCVAPTRENRHRAACIRLGPAARLPVDASAGENYLSFDGRLSASARLKPGNYVATVELAGTFEVLGTLRFTIVK